MTLKKLLVVYAVAAIIGIIGNSSNVAIKSEQGSVKGIETQSVVVTATPTLAPTDTPTPTPTVTPIPTNTPTPTPTPRPVYIPPTSTPTPTYVQQSVQSTQSDGLSNDDYYINSSGNEVHSPAYSNSVPAGATAICGDGTYSFSQSRRGTCSHHGGVAQWL